MHAIGSALVPQCAQHIAQGLGHSVNQSAGPEDDVKAQIFQILAGQVGRAPTLDHIGDEDGVGKGLSDLLQLPFVLGSFDKECLSAAV